MGSTYGGVGGNLCNIAKNYMKTTQSTFWGQNSEVAWGEKPFFE